jgi:hypothetical protein
MSALMSKKTTSMVIVLLMAGSSPSVMDVEVCYLRHSSFSSSQVHSLPKNYRRILPLVAWSSGDPCEFEKSESLPFLKDPHSPKYGFDRGIFNFFCGNCQADTDPSSLVYVVPSSCKQGALCIAPEISPLNSSISCAQQLESSNWFERCMYGLEIFLGVSQKALIGSFRFILCN